MATAMKQKQYPTLNFKNNPRLLPQDVQRRLGLFVGGPYAATNLSSVMIKDRRSGSKHFKLEMWSAPGRSKPTFDEAKQKLDSGHGQAVDVGVKFGPSWTNHWLKMTIDIPSSWAEEEVELNFDPSCEAMLFNDTGDSLQGITGGFDYNRRVEYIIPASEVKKGKCVRYIEVSANGMFGMQPEDQADPNVYYTLETVELVIVNAEARALAYDFEILKQLNEVLPDHSPLGNQARTAANDIMNAFRGSLKDVAACRKIAQRILGSDWEAEYEMETGKKPPGQAGNLWAIGYCHIDTAWLWPWSSTKQKIARSWSSQLDLLDRYPEFRFMATAAQHFRWLEDLYPQVFERLQEKVKSGQFEINGGCWVEMDGNLPSGESFCRQFLYGQRYFESRFGKRTNVLILPDTFGFSPSLPQIARLSGCEYYFSNRVGLDHIDPFPFTSFNWVGLDGSQLLSHVTPINRYDSLCTVDEIVRGHSHHMNLEGSPEAVLAFGHGDGGGGPRPLLLERLRRIRAAGKAGGGQSQELPLIKQGATLSDFFEHLRETSNNGARLPDWHGEIFLQAMRGVLTTQSQTKRNFRKSEILMREVELLSTLASVHTGFAYPKERIDKTWESLCLCMFHDTLPGSSIRLAVKDYDVEFAEIQRVAKELKDSALKALQNPGLELRSSTILNTLPGVARQEVVRHGKEYKLASAEVGDLHALFSKVDSAHAATVKTTADGAVLQNGCLRVEIANGRLASIYDSVHKRELLATGKTAGFQVNQDQPYGGDAWAIEQYDLATYENLRVTSCDVVSEGPARVSVRCGLQVGQSRGTVVISLDACGSQDSIGLLRFDCSMDWHERHHLLKFELPLSFYSDFATYDAAFGVHRRPTTRNTTWEANKFEGTGHKFADYSEHGYGVALLNDCKYGYGIQGSTMSLSLLRGPTAPDEEADQGHHDFSFAVYPHKGTYAESDVQVVAHAFNNPLQVLNTPLSAAYDTVPFIVRGATNVLLETIKRAESDFDARTHIEKSDGGKSVVLRLHEHMGGRACAKLAVHKLQVTRAEIVNILEDSLEELDVTTFEDKEEIDLGVFRAFEVKTVRLHLVNGSSA